MSRSTHNKHTVRPSKSEFKSNTKTSTKVLKSLEELEGHKDECSTISKIIPHVNIGCSDNVIDSNLNAIFQFADLIQNVIDIYERNEVIIKKQDDFICDMLHEFELGSPKDIGRAYKCYTDIRNSRQSRRMAKNENKFLAPLYNYIKSHPALAKEIKTISDKCTVIKHEIETTEYHYKTPV